MINSRNKGKKGEYEVRDMFKRMTGAEWIRTPLSGGLHMSFKGDLMKRPGQPETPLDNIGIEVKNTAKILMPAWIEQVEEAEEDYGGMRGKWGIFFKNKGKWYVTIPIGYFEELIKRLVDN